MKILLAGILCLLSFYCYAQEPIDRDYDFSNVRFDSLDLLTIGAQFDSLWFASGADSLVQLAAHVKRASYIPTYGAVEFGYEVYTASLLHLNSELAALGFANISERFGGVIWGFSAKSPRSLYSFIFSIGTNNKSANDEYDLNVSATNIDLVVGYDVINHPRFQLYPQTAIGFQGWWIEAHRKEMAAPNDLNTWLSQGAEPELNKGQLLLTYGAEANYHLVYSTGGNGVILALKYGLTADIIKGKWKVNGEKWDYKSPDRIKESRLVVALRYYFK